MTEKNNEHWFGNWYSVWNEKDKDNLIESLRSWKQVILNKYSQMNQIGEDQWIIRPVVGWESMINAPPETIALKICLKGKFTESQIDEHKRIETEKSEFND